MEDAAGIALAGAESKFQQHADTSCDGTQVGLLVMHDPATGSRPLIQLNRIPITSSTAVMAMLSAPRDVLGENHEFIKPTEPIPCLQSDLASAIDPGSYVSVPEKIYVPIYRSLASGGADEAPAKYELPEIKLEEGVCVVNSDGSKIMTLRTASLVLSDEKIDEQIKSGKYRTKEDYLIAMKNAAWTEFTRACKDNDVDVSALFECTEDGFGDDRRVVPAPIAVVAFMEEFYPCLKEGSDIIVLIPPIIQGKAVMNTAFSLKLEYLFVEAGSRIWLPSLHHNDAEVEGNTYTLKENYFIYSNDLISLKIPDTKTGISTEVRLSQPHEFLPELKTPNWAALAEHVGEAGSYMVNMMRNLPHGAAQQDEPELDYEAWGLGCTQFQQKRHASMKEKLESANVLGGLKLMHDGFSYRGVMTNILGKEIPKECNFAQMCAFTQMDGSKHTEELRKLMQRHKEDKKRKNDDLGLDKPPAKRLAPPQPEPDVVMPESQTSLEDPSTAMLKEALDFAEARSYLHMATFIARGMDTSYVVGHDFKKENIKVELMSSLHKTQMSMMLRGVAA